MVIKENYERIEKILSEKLSQRDLEIAKHRYLLFGVNEYDKKKIQNIVKLKGKKLLIFLEEFDSKVFKLLKNEKELIDSLGGKDELNK